MDRKYLEENLLAYLDGELPEDKIREFEQSLAEHPDLLAKLERYRKLDALASSAGADMPAPGYFDNLAERIDARVGRMASPQRPSLLSRLLHPRSRTLAWAGSAAAVLLVAAIAWQTREPAVQQFYQPPPAVRSEGHKVGAPPQKPAAEADDSRLTLPHLADEMKIEDSLVPLAEMIADSELAALELGQMPEEPITDGRSKAAYLIEESPAEPEATASGSLRLAEPRGDIEGGLVAGDSDKQAGKSLVKGPGATGDVRVRIAPEAVLAEQLRNVPAMDSVLMAPAAAKSVPLEEVAAAPEIPRATQQVVPTAVQALELEPGPPLAIYDSLIAHYDSQSGDEADSLAAAFAFARAVAYPTADHIKDATTRIETLLDGAQSPATRQHYRGMLERLGDL